jgi:hypothetical protein
MCFGAQDRPSTAELGDRLQGVLDEVAGQDVDALRPDQAAAWLKGVQRAINRLESERTRRVRAFDGGGDFAPEDATSTAAWLSEHLHLTSNAAYALVRTAKRLEETPEAEGAFARGEFGFVHAMIVSRTLEQVRAAAPQQCRQAERFLVEQARSSDASDLSTTALNLRYQLDQDGFLEDENRRRRDRWLHLRELQNGSGAFHLEGRLDAEGGVTLRTALQSVMGPRRGPVRDRPSPPGRRRPAGAGRRAAAPDLDGRHLHASPGAGLAGGPAGLAAAGLGRDGEAAQLRRPGHAHSGGLERRSPARGQGAADLPDRPAPGGRVPGRRVCGQRLPSAPGGL